ncbi:hypothetical protein MKW92_010317 [Papaver armeniacum]|nr:hypothetical protein MKW92_010317 [Papaver armeniacum]
MADKLCVLWRTYCRKFKPHLLMVLAHMCFTFLYFITQVAFNHGMNPHVYVTYRHVVSGLAVLPFAYFLERNVRPKLTLALFAEIFALSLIGICLTLNMYFISMKYTSPTFIAAMINTVASLTLVIAVVLRLEVLDIRSSRGMAKILGTSVSFAGVLIVTLFKGPAIRNLWGAVIRIEKNSVEHENWLKGSLLAVSSCVTWSIWYIMQAVTLKKYPAQLSLTAWMSILGAAQSAVLTAFVEHRPKAWAIGINVEWFVLAHHQERDIHGSCILGNSVLDIVKNVTPSFPFSISLPLVSSTGTSVNSVPSPRIAPALTSSPAQLPPSSSPLRQSSHSQQLTTCQSSPAPRSTSNMFPINNAAPRSPVTNDWSSPPVVVQSTPPVSPRSSAPVPTRTSVSAGAQPSPSCDVPSSTHTVADFAYGAQSKKVQFLSTLMVAVVEYFIVGERLYTGR